MPRTHDSSAYVSTIHTHSNTLCVHSRIYSTLCIIAYGGGKLPDEREWPHACAGYGYTRRRRPQLVLGRETGLLARAPTESPRHSAVQATQFEPRCLCSNRTTDTTSATTTTTADCYWSFVVELMRLLLLLTKNTVRGHLFGGVRRRRCRTAVQQLRQRQRRGDQLALLLKVEIVQ